ncbi:hypothetical protein BGZ94_002954 [Podila epigama]|nr:hypothetical protein BGZ94_002954 [Podila epigama]
MPGHWGALEVGFVNRKISFGDSLKRPVPDGTIESVRRWLGHSLGNMAQWRRDTCLFDVPRQPAASGSCAVNALNAVEMVVNPRTLRWTHLRSAHHRMRLLRLVTGLSQS